VTAHASPPSAEAWERFVRTFRRRRRGRIQVVVELTGEGAAAARMVATFVALERLDDGLAG
jgi:hypothetical protein